jgi:hypothetical protein
MRWAGYVALMVEMRKAKFLSENMKELGHAEDLDIDGKVILEWMLGKESGKMWTEFMWLSVGTSDRLL